jgi:Bacterial transcriptional activator domain
VIPSGENVCAVATIKSKAPPSREEDPLVEPLTAALMRALHAAGRSAQALDRYVLTASGWSRNSVLIPVRSCRRRTRRSCVVSPINPGQRPGPVARPVVAGQVTVVPAQLPADVAGFAGRAEQLAWLDTLLAGEDADAAAPAAVVISAVSGTAGVDNRAGPAMGSSRE